MTRRCQKSRDAILLSLSLLVAATSAAGAQKRITGVSKCGEPAEQHSIAVGDAQGHALGVSKVNCTWTKPFDIEGLKSTEDEITSTSEATGNSLQERLYVTTNMSNGDKTYVRASGTTFLKDGEPQSANGTWSYTGGTGKLTGIKGKGTYKCTWGSDKMATCDVQGHYTVAKKAKGATNKKRD
jgi:hypothetical protein